MSTLGYVSGKDQKSIPILWARLPYQYRAPRSTPWYAMGFVTSQNMGLQGHFRVQLINWVKAGLLFIYDDDEWIAKNSDLNDIEYLYSNWKVSEIIITKLLY